MQKTLCRNIWQSKRQAGQKVYEKNLSDVQTELPLKSESVMVVEPLRVKLNNFFIISLPLKR